MIHRQRRRALRSLPAVLAITVVALQIAYPWFSDGARARLTIVTVVVFAAASASHAWLARGAGFAGRLVVVTGVLGLLAETVGVHTGLPFGAYTYTGGLGPTVLNVPLVIPLAWLMMAYPAAVLGQRIAGSAPVAVLVAGLALAAWDLFLDPQMVAEGYWRWEQAGPHLAGIPLTNYAGWVLVALVMQALIVPKMPPADDDRAPIVLYVWTWAGSVIAHAFFWGAPLVAVTGGLAMGAVVLAVARVSPVRTPRLSRC